MPITGTRAYVPPRSPSAAKPCALMRSEPCGLQRSRDPFPTGGGLAQLGEHYVRNVGVAGSTPVPSTKFVGHEFTAISRQSSVPVVVKR